MNTAVFEYARARSLMGAGRVRVTLGALVRAAVALVLMLAAYAFMFAAGASGVPFWLALPLACVMCYVPAFLYLGAAFGLWEVV